MYLNKTAGNASAADTKQAGGLHKKNQSAANAKETQVSLQKKTIDTQTPRSPDSLLKASGLPNDKLSASVISLARFFSLALKPDNLAGIRSRVFALQNSRQAASQQAASQQAASQNNESVIIKNFTKDSSAEKTRTAFSLAAAAAESKGVELQPKGLELYAESIDPDAADPDQQKKQDGREQRKEQEKNEQDEQEENKNISAAGIKKNALGNAENNPVLQIMNKLPGKNGQRWIVLPFEFSQDNRDYKVSMRVLMEREKAVFTAIEILQGAGSRGQGTDDRGDRQSIALEFANNKVSRITYYKSENRDVKKEKNKERIKKELAELFEIPLKNVFIKTGEQGSIYVPEADYGGELLRFIDEAV